MASTKEDICDSLIGTFRMFHEETKTYWFKDCDCDENDICQMVNNDETFKGFYCCVCDKQFRKSE